MSQIKPHIIIIDDDLAKNDPLIPKILKEGYTVDVAASPDEGIALINQNIDKKIIVLLDYKFDIGGKNGSAVFNDIQNISLLIPVIIWTANSDRVEEYQDLINKHAFSLLTKSSAKAVIEKIKEAEAEINNRVEGAIEEWITIQNQEKRAAPFIVSAYGEQYTLDQILKEVRLQTEFGQRFEKDLLMLTIDRLIRGKETLK